VTVTPFLDLIYVINTGISYGLFNQDGHGGQWALASFAVLTSLGLTVWLARGATNWAMAVGIGFIIGGAVANALDRLLAQREGSGARRG
jgi:signal peptidase II